MKRKGKRGRGEKGDERGGKEEGRRKK